MKSREKATLKVETLSKQTKAKKISAKEPGPLKESTLKKTQINIRKTEKHRNRVLNLSQT